MIEFTTNLFESKPYTFDPKLLYHHHNYKVSWVIQKNAM